MLSLHISSHRRRFRSPQKEMASGRRWLFYLSLAFFLMVILGTLALVVASFLVARELPSPDRLLRHRGFASQIYDRHGRLLFDVYHQAKRTPVSAKDIPDYLKWATIAIEDRHFYSHPGFSIRGILRALYHIVVYHRLEGGSTLTQQLVKVVLLSPRRTLGRKFKEFLLALETERKYSKDQILLMYLNEAPYGGNAWGVGAAAEEYFAKKVANLTLPEIAILAGLPQRPSYYSPYGSHPHAYLSRARAVLRRMREDGYIDRQTEASAAAALTAVKFVPRQEAIKAPHFVFWVKQQLEKEYGASTVEEGGLRVKTSLDLDLQQESEEIVRQELAKVKRLHITNAAVLVLNPKTGEILTMIGSKDYFAKDIDGKFNVVSQALRQPGSAIKPVTYALALEKGYTAATLLMDVKTVFPQGPGQPDYIPVNYDGKYHGPLQLRYALGNSINIPAVKMLALVGLKNMLAKAAQMGIKSLAPTKENLRRFGLAVTLGGGEVRMVELAGAYTAFANRGQRVQPVGILEVKGPDNRQLAVFHPLPGAKVLSPATAFIISDILADDNARLISFGRHSGLYIPGKKVAVKTGTTNDKRDNWAIGWTANLLVAVWVGNNDNSPMKQVASGISGATPIWRRVMLAALKRYGYQPVSQPADVHQMGVDRVSGYPAHDGFPSRQEYFRRGTEPVGPDPIHRKLKVCRQENKLATPAQIAQGDYQEKEFFIFKEEDPVSKDGKNRWQEGILNWLAQQKDPRYHPPREYCQDKGLIALHFQEPTAKTTVANDFRLKVNVDSVYPLKWLRVSANGEEIAYFTHLPYKKMVHLDDGVYQLKATAVDDHDNQATKEIQLGVNLPWDWQPSPTPWPTLVPTATVSAAPQVSPSP